MVIDRHCPGSCALPALGPIGIDRRSLTFCFVQRRALVDIAHDKVPLRRRSWAGQVVLKYDARIRFHLRKNFTAVALTQPDVRLSSHL